MTKNKNIHALYSLTFSFLFVFVFMGNSMAQQQQRQVREDFSEDELESFVDAYEEVLEIQMESEEKMKEAIEKENLTLERFNEILTAQQDPTSEVQGSAEEMAAFNNAAQTIIKERQETETKVVSAIEDEGIDINTYQEIMLAYQYSPKVKKQLDALLED
ncbi:hypothetical protein C900_01415 [Fulvivirga imtechensis AK7]|uniref:DUF4168 domain-containing protein n=1 Tax=Fulvivirga imtechensis AK7 TaxID=1237149 RepID=L8JYF8_9BACT|nr:DUF4168 domain-containing protein [Fulvivirga imtechensis]ELR73805.1 hypothetical protein C900_01415 [Fulvivirga imtechensis AK7]